MEFLEAYCLLKNELPAEQLENIYGSIGVEEELASNDQMVIAAAAMLYGTKLSGPDPQTAHDIVDAVALACKNIREGKVVMTREQERESIDKLRHLI